LAGLGNRFESDLEQAILKLNQNPFAFKAINKNIRRIYLIRFPYLIFYEVVQSNFHIYGVMHSKRNPQTMKKRFKNIRVKP
jgi:toxin ParE1/3/4